MSPRPDPNARYRTFLTGFEQRRLAEIDAQMATLRKERTSLMQRGTYRMQHAQGQSSSARKRVRREAAQRLEAAE